MQQKSTKQTNESLLISDRLSNSLVNGSFALGDSHLVHPDESLGWKVSFIDHVSSEQKQSQLFTPKQLSKPGSSGKRPDAEPE